MAKYQIYSFEFMGETFESDSMKDCVQQYYNSPLRVWAKPLGDFDIRYEEERGAWEAYFKNHGKIVEFEVEGG